MNVISLSQVAEATLAGERFDLALRTFLDQFRSSPDLILLKDEPGCLSGRVPQGEVFDAYLGATADALSAEFHLAVPDWAASASRRLPLPWFALPWAGLRSVLLLESPAPFRSRNLFVSANALTRA